MIEHCADKLADAVMAEQCAFQNCQDLIKAADSDTAFRSVGSFTICSAVCAPTTMASDLPPGPIETPIVPSPAPSAVPADMSPPDMSPPGEMPQNGADDDKDAGMG